VALSDEGKTVTVTLPELAETSPVSTPRTAEPTGAAPTGVAVVVPTAERHSKLVPIVVGVGALALGGAGLAFELSAESTYNQAKAEVTSQTRRDSLYNSANTLRYVADGAAAAGIAAAGATVWIYLHGRGERTVVASRDRHIILTPTGFALIGGF
jgi:hypothetical protein